MAHLMVAEPIWKGTEKRKQQQVTETAAFTTSSELRNDQDKGQHKVPLLSLRTERSISRASHTLACYLPSSHFYRQGFQASERSSTCPSRTVNVGQLDSRTHTFSHSMA